MGTSGYFFSIWVDRDARHLRIRYALALRFSVSETEHTSFLFYHFVKGLSILFPKSRFKNVIMDMLYHIIVVIIR